MKKYLKNILSRLWNWVLFWTGIILSIGLYFLVYAGYTSMTTVWTGSWLTATAWNDMVNNISYLKTTNDTQWTQITALQTKDTDLQTQITSINTSWGCPSGKSMIDFWIMSVCTSSNVSEITATYSTYFNAKARVVNWVIQTRMRSTSPFCPCDSWRKNWLTASCTYWACATLTATTTPNWVCYSTTCTLW